MLEKGFDCAWLTAGAQKTSSSAASTSPSFPLELHTALGTETVKVKVAQTLCDPMDSPWNSPGQNIGVSSLFIFLSQFGTSLLFLYIR